MEILSKHNDSFQYKVEWGTDLQTEHERFLTEQIYKKPVFVTDYPQGDQVFLYACERRRKDRGCGGYAGARRG